LAKAANLLAIIPSAEANGNEIMFDTNFIAVPFMGRISKEALRGFSQNLALKLEPILRSPRRLKHWR